MDCARVDLIAYHFATETDEERDLAEKHLLSCKSCLAAYLALKRHGESAGPPAERPGDAVRARLRRDVERQFRPRLAKAWNPFAWLGRPIPLYQGIAAATLALLVAVLAPTLARRATAPVLRGGDDVDTSRRSAESLSIY